MRCQVCQNEMIDSLCATCGWDVEFSDPTTPDLAGGEDPTVLSGGGERLFDAPTRPVTYTHVPLAALFGGDDVMVGSGVHVETLRASEPGEAERTLRDIEDDPELARENGHLDAPTGSHTRVVVPASVRVDKATWEFLDDDVVLRPAASFDQADCSIFERVVLKEINGERPNARLARRVKITMPDLRIALALLIERGAVELVGQAERSLIDQAPVEAPVNDTRPVAAPAETRDFRDVQLYHAAMQAETAGEYGKALQLLDAALMVNPKAAPVWNRRGVIFATQMQDVRSAVDCLERAVALAPENDTYRKNLAKVKALVTNV